MAKQKVNANPILSSQIRLARKANKVTQEKLAEMIGVTEQTIRKYESGKYGVPDTSVKCIANALGCCCEFLYGKTNSFTVEEYLDEQSEIKELVQKNTAYLNTVKQQWEVTRSFFETFLGYKIVETYKHEKDGSFYPIIRITDANNRSFTFFSRRETENFLLTFFDDIKKLLGYHLLAHEDSLKTSMQSEQR